MSSRAQDIPPPSFAQRRAKLARGAVCALLFAVAGCGDDPTPTERCDDLLTTMCSRVVGCVGGVTEPECMQELQAAVPCGDATGVRAGYDRCMQQLRGFTCSTLFPIDPQTGETTFALPADCEDVFETGGEATGPNQPIEEAVGSLMQSEP